MQTTRPLCYDDQQSLTVNRVGQRILKQSACLQGGLRSVRMLNSAHLFRVNEAVDRWEDKQEIMVHSLLLNELELHLGSDAPKDRVLFSQNRARRREGHQKKSKT